MVAEVIINTNAKELNKGFDYIVPTRLLNDIKIGSRVFVPFGNKKVQEGFIIDIKEKSSFANKEIIKVEDSILTKDNILLAKLMSRRYFCNISDCIKLMLPPGSSQKNISNRIKEKTASFVFLKESIDINNIEVKIKSEKQLKVLNFLKENNDIILSDLLNIINVNINIIKTLEKNGYIEIIKNKIERNPFIHKNIKRDESLTLNKQQQEAYKKMDVNKYKEFLLFGITGSRENGNIFAINREKNSRRKNCNCFSA